MESCVIAKQSGLWQLNTESNKRYIFYLATTYTLQTNSH